MKEGWEYCPYCGARLEKRDIFERFPGIIDFGPLFKDIDREFRRMEEMFRELRARKEEEFKPEEIFKSPYRGGGVSIRITSEAGKEPRIEVKTFGDYKEHEPEIRKRFGIPEAKERAPPKVTEEPETRIERVEGKLIFRIKVPGVKSEEDVEIQRMEESIEVRAYAEDKAYFTLFSVPRGARVLSKKLEKGELTIEIG